MQFPENFKYTKDHEWAKIEGNTVVVGITGRGHKYLVDVVYGELPQAGRSLEAGEDFGVVESIKAVSDLYSPISGKVTQVNSGLAEDPAQLNKDPHGTAWMI